MSEKRIHSTAAPELVDLVALGESTRSDWWRFCLEKDRAVEDLMGFREIWTVNRGVMIFQSDICFVLDEIDNEAKRDPRYGDALDEALYNGRPKLVTTRLPDATGYEFKRWEEVYTFPARAVMTALDMDPEKDDPYWHNSIPMIVAYAIAIGVKHLRIWGADYTMPDGRVLEADRANLEFWLGRAKERGVQISVPPSTTLLNNRTVQGLKVYGLVEQTRKSARDFLTSGDVELWA